MKKDASLQFNFSPNRHIFLQFFFCSEKKLGLKWLSFDCFINLKFHIMEVSPAEEYI